MHSAKVVRALTGNINNNGNFSAQHMWISGQMAACTECFSPFNIAVITTHFPSEETEVCWLGWESAGGLATAAGGWGQGHA